MAQALQAIAGLWTATAWLRAQSAGFASHSWPMDSDGLAQRARHND